LNTQCGPHTESGDVPLAIGHQRAYLAQILELLDAAVLSAGFTIRSRA
jgi:hypothetical protein